MYLAPGDQMKRTEECGSQIEEDVDEKWPGVEDSVQSPSGEVGQRTDCLPPDWQAVTGPCLTLRGL